MSKAMDALEELELLEGFVSRHAGEIVTEESFAIIRDYIKTTEAERAKRVQGAEDLCDKITGLYEARRIFEAGEAIGTAFLAQRQLGRDESAARIKELEEALRVAQKGMNQRRIFGYNLDKGHLSSLWDAEDAQVQAALSGARKVGL